VHEEAATATVEPSSSLAQQLRHEQKRWFLCTQYLALCAASSLCLKADSHDGNTISSKSVSKKSSKEHYLPAHHCYCHIQLSPMKLGHLAKKIMQTTSFPAVVAGSQHKYGKEPRISVKGTNQVPLVHNTMAPPISKRAE
jgi:hypothetical protein